MRTWLPSNGEIMPCSAAMRLIQRSDFTLMRLLSPRRGRPLQRRKIVMISDSTTLITRQVTIGR